MGAIGSVNDITYISRIPLCTAGLWEEVAGILNLDKRSSGGIRRNFPFCFIIPVCLQISMSALPGQLLLAMTTHSAITQTAVLPAFVTQDMLETAKPAQVRRWLRHIIAHIHRPRKTIYLRKKYGIECTELNWCEAIIKEPFSRTFYTYYSINYTLMLIKIHGFARNASPLRSHYQMRRIVLCFLYICFELWTVFVNAWEKRWLWYKPRTIAVIVFMMQIWTSAALESRAVNMRTASTLRAASRVSADQAMC